MMTNKKVIYAPEFKNQAISLVKEANTSAAQVARDLNIKVSTLYTWLSHSSDKSCNKTTDQDSSAEIKRLKKELAQAELERDILKKAAAYFAKETL